MATQHSTGFLPLFTVTGDPLGTRARRTVTRSRPDTRLTDLLPVPASQDFCLTTTGDLSDPAIDTCSSSSIGVVPRVQVVATTSVPPERVLEAARDFSERRAELWPDVHVAHLQVHETGENFAVVTEGNPWPIGFVWERLHYDWSEAGVVKGTVTDSNIFKPGSTWEIRATPDNGGSRVEVIGVRHLSGLKGRLLSPAFPLGLAKRTVDAHLRHFLSKVEESAAG